MFAGPAGSRLQRRKLAPPPSHGPQETYVHGRSPDCLHTLNRRENAVQRFFAAGPNVADRR